MSPFEEFARRVKRDLDRLHVLWAFVGGLAVSTHGYPRFTNDIDVAVAVEGDAEAERLINLLFRQGYQMLADLERDDGRMSTAAGTGEWSFCVSAGKRHCELCSQPVSLLLRTVVDAQVSSGVMRRLKPGRAPGARRRRG